MQKKCVPTYKKKQIHKHYYYTCKMMLIFLAFENYLSHPSVARNLQVFSLNWRLGSYNGLFCMRDLWSGTVPSEGLDCPLSFLLIFFLIRAAPF